MRKNRSEKEWGSIMKEMKNELNTMEAVAAFQPEADRYFTLPTMMKS